MREKSQGSCKETKGRMKQMVLKAIIKRIYLFCRSICLNLLGEAVLSLPHKEFKKEEVKRILLIKLERVGDLVLSTPVLRELKNKFSESYIAILVNDYNKDVVIADSHIDEVLILQNRRCAYFAGLFRLIRKIRGMYFDLVIDLTACDNMFLPVLISYLSKAKYTLGLNQFGRGFLFNIKINYDPKDRPLAELMFDIVRPLGVYSDDLRPQINVPSGGRIFAEELLSKSKIKNNDLLIGIHPGGYYPSQRWCEEGFAKVADELIKRYAAKVFILGGRAEKSIVFKIGGLMQNKPQGMISGITLQQLIAVISNLDILICNNSGPLHIAAALGIPTVSTMGPTLPKRWWPMGENHIVVRKALTCSPCNLGRCGRHECMQLITPEDILEAVETQLKNAKGRSGDGYPG